MGFQTTYEELKLSKSFLRFQSKTCFQTTYEELKLEGILAMFGPVGLPDYLWGIETIAREESILKVWLPDYLWGIETRDFPRSHGLVAWLPDYLWGIETKSPLPANQERNGFQTTYEELKQILSLRGPSDSLASRLPMRNWNGTPTQ